MQESIDLAAHLVGDEGWGPAPSLRDHFEILERHGAISDSVRSQLSGGVKVRNLIGHAYAEIDPLKLFEAARVVPDLMEAYCAEIIRWSEAQAPG